MALEMTRHSDRPPDRDGMNLADTGEAFYPTTSFKFTMQITAPECDRGHGNSRLQSNLVQNPGLVVGLAWFLRFDKRIENINRDDRLYV
jgi:hypothetical protein